MCFNEPIAFLVQILTKSFKTTLRKCTPIINQKWLFGPITQRSVDRNHPLLPVVKTIIHLTRFEHKTVIN